MNSRFQGSMTQPTNFSFTDKSLWYLVMEHSWWPLFEKKARVWNQDRRTQYRKIKSIHKLQTGPQRSWISNGEWNLLYIPPKYTHVFVVPCLALLHRSYESSSNRSCIIQSIVSGLFPTSSPYQLLNKNSNALLFVYISWLIFCQSKSLFAGDSTISFLNMLRANTGFGDNGE